MGTVLAFLIGTIYFFWAKGFVYWLLWIISYCYLRITSRYTRRRLDLYDFGAEGQPEKTGLFVPHEEQALEDPQGNDRDEKNADDVFCMGVNSRSESLAFGISRHADGQVHCALTLRLENGKTYTLPPEHTLQTETEEPHTFGSARLKMQCLLPMRKWRVFYNGILCETSDNQEDQTSRYRHVTFSFIWTASSDVFDYKHDMSLKHQAHIAAEFSSWKCPPLLFLRRLNRMFDMYEQCGMLLGTVTVEDEKDKEVYLWGQRSRHRGRISDYQELQISNVYANAENGTFVRLGLMRIPGFHDKLLYGFILRPNGFILPIEYCQVLKRKDGSANETHFECSIDGETFTVKLAEEDLKSKFHEEFTPVTGHVNSMTARGLVSKCKIQKPEAEKRKPQKHLSSKQSRGLLPEYVPLSVSFMDHGCQVLSVSGGKGSSLAKLTCISKELKSFTVPKGIVVTTSAYNSFTQRFLDAPLKELEAVAWTQDQDKTKTTSACEKVMNVMIKAELPKPIEESIERNLFKVFGKEINNIMFAVRSSATGEDTEQMSAAGQMETFLGCKGISEVLTAVKKCWASQFSFVAVEYKRRYGQPLNTPMAVVIQEMVPCEVAGVAFTCDPVTGNPTYITITANYGLGESVVSASAEPDTITLKRDINNKLGIHNKSAGIKQSKIVMDESGGTKEIKLDEETSSKYSISEDIALALGGITIQIETKFGAPRDIEWGSLNGKIFLFQARPVTTIDTETDFEAMHIFDSYLRREDEFSSTANVGEVAPGSMSPLGMDVVCGIAEIAYVRMKYVKWRNEDMPNAPFFPKGLIYAYNHLLFAVIDSVFKFDEQNADEISNHTKALTVAMFGRIIDDKKIFEVSKDRHGSMKKSETSIIAVAYMALYMFFGEYFTKRTSKKIDKLQVPVSKNNTAAEILHNIGEHCDKVVIAMLNHMDCTFTSPFWNLSLLSLLSKARGVWDNDVYRDFGHLLSSCKQVESADIPSAIQSLACSISRCIDSEKFKKMDSAVALQWLQTSTTDTGKKFRTFLERHGHRCLKEFDLYSKTWGMDPCNLVRILQGAVSKDMKDPTEKKADSFQTIVSNMHVKLTTFQRLLLRILLPQCQRGVREREMAKSLLIRGIDKIRAPFYMLADAMVREGRLPDRELLFFLSPSEVNELINTRSPILVSRAYHRWKCHPEMDKLIFPEIMSGIPKPINMDEELDISGDGFMMTGIPVSKGVVKGVARVVRSIEEAPDIQHGEILIAYSTDIAWSPYFPMLSGVVTELGGLISHGAVVAREYGLPCVVGLHGATRAFKSGEFVLLDGNRGILQKIESL